MRNKAIINLKNLVYNVNSIKKLLPQNTKFCAVVKADAYGHGAEQISNALYTHCDMFAVALIEEGISLRRAGIDKEILVLTPPFIEDLENAVLYNLTLTVDTIFLAKKINFEAKRQNRKINIHVKYNTGMNRFGVDNLTELNNLLRYISSKNNIKFAGLYSHLYNSSNKKDYKAQIQKFLLAKNIAMVYNKKVICHISASGGTIQGYYFDMVRIGIMLYGYKPFKTNKIKLKKVMTVVVSKVKVRQLKKGENALYGKYIIKNKKVVSILRFGYADGLDRKNNKNLINNRCMDISMVSGNIKKVTLDIEKIAREEKTITYEILTKVAMRAEKIYRN